MIVNNFENNIFKVYRVYRYTSRSNAHICHMFRYTPHEIDFAKAHTHIISLTLSFSLSPSPSPRVQPRKNMHCLIIYYSNPVKLISHICAFMGLCGKMGRTKKLQSHNSENFNHLSDLFFPI